MRPAVFLDRDDTLIPCRGVAPHNDLGDPDLVRLAPHAREALADLRQRGFALVVVTNQGGVARGRYTTDDVEAVHQRLNQLLGGLIDDFRYCPWHPDASVERWRGEHHWRKPAPGMILDAAEDLDIDLSFSWLIGDAPRDCHAGRAAGVRTILLSPDPPPRDDPAIQFTAPDLRAAADLILREHGP